MKDQALKNLRLLRNLASVSSYRNPFRLSQRSLSLVGFSDSEQRDCLDLLDICCVSASYFATEIFIKTYSHFLANTEPDADGLLLVRVPDSVSVDGATEFALRLHEVYQSDDVSIVPVFASRQQLLELFPIVAPYCDSALTADSDALDFVTVLSALLHLPGATRQFEFDNGLRNTSYDSSQLLQLS